MACSILASTTGERSAKHQCEKSRYGRVEIPMVDADCNRRTREPSSFRARIHIGRVKDLIKFLSSIGTMSPSVQCQGISLVNDCLFFVYPRGNARVSGGRVACAKSIFILKLYGKWQECAKYGLLPLLPLTSEANPSCHARAADQILPPTKDHIQSTPTGCPKIQD